MDLDRIVRSEVAKAVRRHPTWACYAEDLYQDAHEAILRYCHRPDLGSHVRVCVRHAIVRKALGYFYVSQRTGKRLGYQVEDYDFTWQGEDDLSFQDYEDADELRWMRQRKEARLTRLAASISRRKPLEHRMQTVEMYYRYKTSGETMEQIAADYGISKQAVSLRLAVAARDLEQVAA